LAILQVSKPVGKPLLLGASGEVGDDIYVVGSPRRLEGTFSTGVVSAYREHDDHIQLQISAPISSGSSGGPVLNNQARVIGVSVSTIVAGQNLNFAVPVEYLRELMSKLRP
jgi:S1-C subfamily serine protease